MEESFVSLLTFHITLCSVALNCVLLSVTHVKLWLETLRHTTPGKTPLEE